MAPSMMESIVMRKCDIPLKTARAIIKEAKENIELKRACLWSKEWEQECLRIHQSEKAPLQADEAEKRAQEGATAHRLRQAQTVSNSGGARITPLCGGVAPSSDCDDDVQQVRHESKVRVSNRELERQPSISHSYKNRSKSASTSRQQCDKLIGMCVSGDTEELRQPKKKIAASCKKSKTSDGSIDSVESSERNQHRRSRSTVRSDDSNLELDERASIRRSISHSQSLSRRSHTLPSESEQPDRRREKHRERSKSRRSHETDGVDATCQRERHHRSVSRQRSAGALPNRPDSDGIIARPTRRSTIALVNRPHEEPPRAEKVARTLSHEAEPKERARSKSRRESLNRSGHSTKCSERPKERSRSKSRRQSINQSAQSTKCSTPPDDRSLSTSRRASPDRSECSSRSSERRRSSHDDARSSERLSGKKDEQQFDHSPEPVTLKSILPRRMSSSDDEDDDISLDLERSVSRTSFSSADSGNALSRHLENLCESIGKTTKSRTSIGSHKSGGSAGKTRMIPVVRGSICSVSPGKSTYSSSPRKTMTKLKAPSMGAPEPSHSALRSGRYTQSNRIALRLPDLGIGACDDFDHPEHDSKTLTSRTVSTVSTSSSDDWVDFF